MEFVLCLQRPAGEPPRLGEPLLDEYLRFVAAGVGRTRCWLRCST
jgi:hypothetical protein